MFFEEQFLVQELKEETKIGTTLYVQRMKIGMAITYCLDSTKMAFQMWVTQV